MDKKGIQLGIVGRTAALVDRDQRQVKKIESGNRELVTIIECVCADGIALRPSIVFQGARRDLRWSKDNPCDARSGLSFTKFVFAEHFEQRFYISKRLDRSRTWCTVVAERLCTNNRNQAN